MLEQHANGVGVTPFRGPDQRRPTTGLFDVVHVRTGIEEDLHDIRVPVTRGEHQGRITTFFVQIDTSAGLEQRLYRFQPPKLRSQHQGRSVTDIAPVDLPTFASDRRHQRPCLALLGKVVQRNLGFNECLVGATANQK